MRSPSGRHIGTVGAKAVFGPGILIAEAVADLLNELNAQLGRTSHEAADRHLKA